MALLVSVLALLLACFAGPAWAQSDDVDPDRPGVGTSPQLVPRGALQLETGVDHGWERRAGESTGRRTSLVTTLRYGLLDAVELRLDMEPIVALRGPEDATDVGDVILSAKLRLREGAEGAPWPALALLPAIKLPTAPEPIGSERVDVALVALGGWQFGPLGLGFNAGVATIGQEKGYLVQGLLVGAATFEVIDNLTLLVELFYRTPEERNGDDFLAAVAGASYKITKDVAVDAAVIASLAGRGQDYRVQTGITVRFWP